MIERTGKSRVILVRLSNHRGAKSLVFGSHSLINRIRRTLWVQQQLEEACGEGYLDIDIEACYEFVTLLNMRDHGELNGQPVTEQIYVHSKRMIVDDRWVLVGSANINDRSLLGDGDSELAVTIADMDYSVNDLDGSGTPEPCRTFARDLREKAWRKWMGSAAVECEEALDKPALKASWEKIQALALNNSIAYDVVFNFIPRNSFEPESSNEINYTGKQDSENEDNIPASIWPILAVNRTDVPHNKINMPFSEVFWRKYHGKKFNNKFRLHDIKGYFTSLAPEWTSGEDNLIPYNMRLIAEYNMQKDDNKKLAIVKIDSSDMETL